MAVACCILPVLILALIGQITTSETEMEIDCNHRELEGKTIWNCSDVGDFSFPETHIPFHITIMDYSHNLIQELPAIIQDAELPLDCSKSGNLRELYLHHNKIEAVPDDVFQSLHCLRVLDLSFNKFSGEKITAKTFQGLHKLQKLNLRGNPLEIIKDTSFLFSDLNNLKFLDISQCQIKIIENNALNHLYIDTLNLSSNSLTELNKWQFNGLNFLHDLDLSNNQLTEINNLTFHALLALQNLNLSSNTIFHLQIGAFEGLDRLESMSLRNNKLGDMPYQTFEYLKKYLKELDLSGNLFNSIGEVDSGLTTNIEILRLEELPRLKSVGSRATKMFPHLKSIYLRGNPSLNSISEYAFKDSFSNLQFVYISENHLETIYHNTFPWKQLKELKWSGNPWNCDCHLKWLVTLHEINTTLTCHAPTKFEGRRLQELHPLDLKCPRSFMYILIGVVLALCCLSIGVMIYLVWKYKGKCTSCHPRQGKYISVYTNEGADDEARATILPVRDDMELTERQIAKVPSEQV
ncbi:hypothetical protein LOTGIDRAFT_229082 [Lottia gigantea]|uniref:LRRCT domain-containing protein n=1 Tax=Lottia gigantea TaxID=225164 RepID=V4A7B1_LOTGI|nr:hypothetical protein LOTGIDRAFT_229082 [Lottia gigantea]ESO89181.1 hypothetical protein LOTGIDRAFT_229082 [Lottia gigantea]